MTKLILIPFILIELSQSFSTYIKYNLKSNYDVLSGYESNCLIKILPKLKQNQCLSYCNTNQNCSYVLFKQTNCYILNEFTANFLLVTVDNNIKLFKKNRLNPNYIVTNGLIHYWPFYNNLIDVMGGANLFGGINNSLSFDQKSEPLSAINLYSGYYQVPSSIFFYGGDFTVMAWINMNSPNVHTRLIDFGNGIAVDNILCAISYFSSQKPFFHIYTPSSNTIIISSATLTVRKWNHLACVLKETTGYIYINGNQVANGPFVKPNAVIRTSNFIGHSNWPNEANADAIIDEIKIFNKGLTQQEIIREMNNNIYL